MLKNYLRITLRSLRKHPLYTGINVVGLAIGLTCCTFIVLYVVDELSYDRFHEHADRIYRVVENQAEEDRTTRLATTYGPLANALRQDFPAVEHAVRVLPSSVLVSREGQEGHQEDDVYFADSTFFEVFDFPLLVGDASTVLDAPFQIVLTETAAQRYFGASNPVGQTLQIRDDEALYDFTVSGLVQDPSSNTHFRFDFVASFASMRTLYSPWIEDPRNWDHPPLYTYVQLADDASADALAAQLPAFAQRHMGERRAATRSLHLECLTDIRLYSSREQDLTPGSDVAYVYLFALIAFFILLLACINFTNLATARATERAKEVGLRKALGAGRGQLVRQFLGESLVMVTLALLLVIVLVNALLPLFNAVSGKALTFDALLHWSVPLLLVGTVVLVGLLAGSYPALYLSRFRPARVLKGNRTTGTPGTAPFRKGLVVVQFAVSIILIIGTLVIIRQLHYMRNERLGFDKEHVVLAPLRDVDNQIQYASLKAAWEQTPGVEHVTASSGMPGLGAEFRSVWQVHPEGFTDTLNIALLTVDHDFVETYGLKIVQGRDFSEAHSTDATEAFLINEAAARRLGWTDPIGKELTVEVWYNEHFDKTGQIVGVVKDFQYHSLRRSIDPLVFHIFPETYYYDYVSARLQPGRLTETLAALEQSWKPFNPDRPFEYRFLDEQFDGLYRAEERLGTLFGYFAGLAVLIACLGLFGLAAFSAEQRTKEIGVRKVLGASVPGIVALLSKDLLKLIAVAFIVAVPLAYLAADQWLAHFAYRIDVPWTLFLLTGLAALVLAWLTVSYHAVRAALTDPVDSLRYE